MEKPIVLYIYINNNNNNNNNNRRHLRPYTLRHQDASFLLTRRHRQTFLQNSVPISKFHSKIFQEKAVQDQDHLYQDLLDQGVSFST